MFHKRTLRLAAMFIALTSLTALPASIGHAGEGGLTGGTPILLDLNLLLKFPASQSNVDAYEQVFRDASEILFNSTEGQMRIGTVNTYVDCEGVDERADIWVLSRRCQDAGVSCRANAGGYAILGDPGKHVTLYHNENTGQPDETPLVVVHELGHHMFGLVDEYQNLLLKDGKKVVRTNKKGKSVWVTSDNFNTTHFDQAVLDAFPFNSIPAGVCTGTSAHPASIMEAGSGLNSHRTEWCTEATDASAFNTEHNAAGVNLGDGFTAINGQEFGSKDWSARDGESSWETIGRILQNRHKVAITVPSTQPDTSNPSGFVDPTWNVVACDARSVISIDRSGSMSGERLRLAKLGGLLFTDIAKVRTGSGGSTVPGDFLGVTSFSSSASVNFGISEVVDETTRNAARAAINAIVDGGSTAIGAGLRTSLNQIASLGDASGNEIIVLLSDGMNNAGESPAAVVNDLKARGVRAFTIGLGAGADTTTLMQIADGTMGKFFFAANEASLPGIFTTVSADVRDGDLLLSSTEPVATNDVVERTVFVDAFQTEVTFVVGWDDNDFDVRLVTPSSAIIDATAAGTDPDVDFLERDNSEVFRVRNPETGTWTIEITPVTVVGDSMLTISTLGTSEETLLTTGSDQADYVFPAPALLQAQVVAGVPVAGVEVVARVTRPDASVVEVMLFDDGDIDNHGDDLPSDGTYSNYFAAYNDDGIYSVEITATNTDGTTAPNPLNFEPGESNPGEDVPPFVRISVLSIMVEGVPEFTVASLAPTTAAPQSTIEISGSGFSSGMPTVFIGGTPAPFVEVVDDGLIRARVPWIPPGPVDVVVEIGGLSRTLSGELTLVEYQAPVPTAAPLALALVVLLLAFVGLRTLARRD